MAYIIPPDRGLHFAFGPWPNCVIGMYDTGGLGQVAFVGTAAAGSEEYDAVSIIAGPGDLIGGAQAAGGIGNYCVNVLMPAANAILQARLNQHPLFAAETNATPASVDTLNIALEEYFKIMPSADGNFPVMSFKPL